MLKEGPKINNTAETSEPQRNSQVDLERRAVLKGIGLLGIGALTGASLVNRDLDFSAEQKKEAVADFVLRNSDNGNDMQKLIETLSDENSVKSAGIPDEIIKFGCSDVYGCAKDNPLTTALVALLIYLIGPKTIAKYGFKRAITRNQNAEDQPAIQEEAADENAAQVGRFSKIRNWIVRHKKTSAAITVISAYLGYKGIDAGYDAIWGEEEKPTAENDDSSFEETEKELKDSRNERREERYQLDSERIIQGFEPPRRDVTDEKEDK